MKKSLWRLTVRDEFCAGHSLRHYEGKCEALHGHNFAVEAVIEGEKLLGNTEILIDFKVMKKALKKILDTLDHAVLNEVSPFDTINPSSENLSRHIYRQMRSAMVEHGVRVHSVTVSEKSAQSATYMEIEE